MTLDDLKSWWKTYSPIIKEAKKRNNLSLLNNYTHVYISMINSARGEIKNDEDLKALKIIERVLNETILDASMEKANATVRRNDGTEGPAGNTNNGPGVENPSAVEESESFIERIRARYGRKREENTERREEVKEEEGRLEGEEGEHGVKLPITLEKGRGGRRHEKKTTYQNLPPLDTQKNILPATNNVLDNLDSLIYSIEQFINTDE